MLSLCRLRPERRSAVDSWIEYVANAPNCTYTEYHYDTAKSEIVAAIKFDDDDAIGHENGILMIENHKNDLSAEASPKRRGFINPRLVNGLAFTIITVCILIGISSSIMAIWQYADTDTLLRTIGTVGVIILGTFLFASVNRWFGD